MPRDAPVGGLAHAFPGAAGCLTAGRARNALADLTLPQQLRQLGDVGGDAACLVAREALVCVTVRLALEAGCRQSSKCMRRTAKQFGLAVNAAIRRSASARVRLGLYASSS